LHKLQSKFVITGKCYEQYLYQIFTWVTSQKHLQILIGAT